MASLLLHRIHKLASMAGDELSDAYVLVKDGWIEEVGSGEPPDGDVDESVDMSDPVVLPRLVHTHPHLDPTLT